MMQPHTTARRPLSPTRNEARLDIAETTLRTSPVSGDVAQPTRIAGRLFAAQVRLFG